MTLSSEHLQASSPARPNREYRSHLLAALQSGLAAGFCLGLPAGLSFWLLIYYQLAPSVPVYTVLRLVQDGFPQTAEIATIFGVVVWGILLGKISGYRQWWWLAAATMAGIFMGDWLLYNGWLDQVIQGHAMGLPVYVRFWMVLAGCVMIETASTGLALGLVLRNWKAGLALSATTMLVSVCAALITIVILDRAGLRVGSGNAAMPKAAAAGTMSAAIAGGAVLGVLFRQYVRAKLSQTPPGEPDR